MVRMCYVSRNTNSTQVCASHSKKKKEISKNQGKKMLQIKKKNRVAILSSGRIEGYINKYL